MVLPFSISQPLRLLKTTVPAVGDIELSLRATGVERQFMRAIESGNTFRTIVAF